MSGGDLTDEAERILQNIALRRKSVIETLTWHLLHAEAERDNVLWMLAASEIERSHWIREQKIWQHMYEAKSKALIEAEEAKDRLIRAMEGTLVAHQTIQRRLGSPWDWFPVTGDLL